LQRQAIPPVPHSEAPRAAVKSASPCARVPGSASWLVSTPALSPPGATGAKSGANVLRPRLTQHDSRRAFAQVTMRNPRFGFAQARAHPQ